LKPQIDNDILIKCSCYALLDDLAAAAGGIEATGVLGVARFVVRKRLDRGDDIQDPSTARTRFEEFLKGSELLEPTPEEVALASAMEEAALRANASLDTGESQLCAIVLLRGARLLLTGDKRALASLELIAPVVPDLAGLRLRVACLEQFVLGVVESRGASSTRALVCNEARVDKTLSICFSCFSETDSQGIPDCLKSYIRAVRAKASTMLLEGDALALS
jgi:hypothetical protein